MTFVGVKVIDKTAETDPRVHGGKMAPGDPDGLLLHHTGSGPSGEQADEAWLSTWHTNPVSINQLVRRDGTIVQIVPNDVASWHAGVSTWEGRSDCNSWMIGVEIANNGVGETYTDAQYEAVSQTCAYNCARYRIPDSHVTSHARVALPAGRKDDPRGWDWARMWRRVDELRANWPWHDIPEWHDYGRVMSTE